ncbi:hypothetical protein [Candidatus Ichthyocystis hellenicum]|uniref:hypothetical protein n=1 Tax=Candidatus Ichthyocystis hellenicum TaxID=1561003 RepID=UPI000B8710AC|nr:hypothetical protein [Candidatus Ichthyocystis hellenicum]
MSEKRLQVGFPFPLCSYDSDLASKCGDQESLLTQESSITGIISSSDKITDDDVVSLLLENYYSYLSNFPLPDYKHETKLLSVCGNYGYCIDTDDMSDFLRDDFFQNYANRNGYELTDGFLSEINGLRNYFVRFISDNLSKNCFNRFLFRIDVSSMEEAVLLIDSNCHYFSRAVYDTRTECVSFLKEIMPLVLGAVNNLSVVDKDNKSVISFIDREMLFIYIITIFERSIILNVMVYWNNFCDLNKELLSSFQCLDYSNPFVRASSNVTASTFSIPVISHPVAFIPRHGVCLSFVSGASLDKIINDCSLDCAYKLITSVKNNGRVVNTITEEFRNLMSEHWINKLVVLFSKLIVWPNSESHIGTSKLDLVKGTIYSILVLVKYQVSGRGFNGSNSGLGGCSFKLSDPKGFSRKVTELRSKKMALFRPVVLEEFVKVIQERSLVSFNWADISGKMFRIAVGAASDIVDDQYRGLKSIISEAHIIDSQGVERKIERKEKNELAKIVMKSSNTALKSATRRLWLDLIGGDGSARSGSRATSENGSSSSLGAGKVGTSKSKGRKRKRNYGKDYAFAGFGSIIVSRAFNVDINRMVLDHLSYTSSVFDDIKENLKEVTSYTTEDDFINDVRIQSRESSVNVISEFMDRVREFVSNANVCGYDKKVRKIDEDEILSFMNDLYGVITLRHNEILFEKLEGLKGNQ